MTTSVQRVAARTGVLLALVLAACLLTSPPVAAQPRPASPDAVSALSAVSRPKNGTILYSGIRGGPGKLTIKNGPGTHGVVTLMRGKTKAISVYVRAKSSTTVSDIKDGTYTVYFTTGSKFDTSKRRFTRGASYHKFSNRLQYAADPPYYDVWTLTLYRVAGGNAPSKKIPPKSFPA